MNLNERLKRNIQVIYVFSFCWLALVIIPVIVPFFASKGLTLAEVFVLQSIFAASIVLFEVPSGYFADVIGRRNALILGSFFHGTGFTILCFAQSFSGLALFEITVGLGMSLLSGADLSLLYDSQIALGMSPREKTRGIANLRFINSTAEGIAALLGGVLAMYSFDLMVYANAVIAWLPFGLAFLLIEAPFERLHNDKVVASFRRILMHLFYQDPVLRLTTLAVTFYGLSTFYVVWLIQPYWQDYGVPLAFFGVLWSLKNFTIGVTAKFCEPLEQKFGPVPVLLAMSILPIVGYFGMAIDGGVMGILLAFGFYVSRGIHQVILTDAFNSRVPSEFRATANSLTSFMFRLTFIVTGPLVGFMYEWQGMSATLAMLGVACVGLFFFLMLPLLRAISGKKPDQPQMEIVC